MPRHFGILVPSTNTTGEVEYCRLAPELQVHTGRLGKGGDTPFSPSKDEDVAYQAKLLGDARVEVIALAQTSASLFADDYDAVTVKRMTEASGVPSLTSAQAIGRALQGAQGLARRHGDALFGRGHRTGPALLRDEVRHRHGGVGEPRRFRCLCDRQDGCRHGRGGVPPDRSAGIDALVVPGGNFPTMDWIAAWERQFGKPVITTNQAALWAVLQTMKVDTPLPGKGRLLEQLPRADAYRRLLAGGRSALIGRGEMRQLIGASLLERGALGHAGHIGFGRGPIAVGADVRDAQDICHQKIRGGEATGGQPFPLVQDLLELAEAVCHPAGKTVVLRAGYLEEPPGNGHHLDRVERGDRPLNRLRFANRIARHQLFALASQMQQPGTALEYLQSAIAQEGNLAERLARQVIGLPSVERDGAHRIAESASSHAHRSLRSRTKPRGPSGTQS
jgi:maleate cis-trans isomerase